MHKIRITADDVLFIHRDDEEKSRSFSSDDSMSMIHHLDAKVEIDEGVTFERILRAFIEDPCKDIFNILLTSYSGGRPSSLDDFAAILDLPIAEGKEPTDLEYVYIELGPVTLHEYADYNSRKGEKSMLFGEEVINNGDLRSEYNTRWLLHGHGLYTPCAEEGGGEPFYASYAIEYTPVNELMHLPFIIRDKVIFYDRALSDKNYKKIKKSGGAYKSVEIEQFDASCSVFELITAIIWEMTWGGIIQPGQRTLIDECKESLDEYRHEKEIDNILGELNIAKSDDSTEEESDA